MNTWENVSRICKQCKMSYIVTKREIKHLQQSSVYIWWEAFNLNFPTLCSSCRHRRRLSFRNERNLYRRICDASKQPIISIYAPNKIYKVYDQKIRRSDSRDPLEFWRSFDFSKTFTEQFRELMNIVPRLSMQVQNSENSEYTNPSIWLKNCYLSYWSEYWEDYYYSTHAFRSSMVFDSYWVFDSQIIFNSYYIWTSQNIFSSSNMMNCSFCFECSDCIWCNNCYWCSWLQNAQYHIENKPVTKEVFKEVMELYSPSRSKKNSNIESISVNSDTSTWNLLTNCNNCISCTLCTSCEDSSDIFVWAELQDSYNCSYVWFWSSRLYECQSIVKTQIWIWCNVCRWPWSHLFYSDFCFWNISHLFWCTWIRDRSYCILNKHLTKLEYEKTLIKIIAHMQNTGERWEFFHPSLSPFWYNESLASLYYPLSRTHVEKNWFNRSDYQPPLPQSKKIIDWAKLHWSIEAIDSSILSIAIKCSTTWKLFRIQPKELSFYKKHAISVPQKHPDQRHRERLQLKA